MLKNTKKVFSIILAVAVVAMSMFTGVVVSAADPVTTAHGTVDLLEFGQYLIDDLGSTNKYYDTKLADNGETGADWENAIIIDSAEELVYLCKASGDDTIGKYYKVADGIAGFNLATDALDIDGTLAENLDVIKGSGKNHSGNTPGFQGHFDGNGATVYGAWTNDTYNETLQAWNTPVYAGLFSCVKGEVTIKNIHVNKAYFVGKNAAGGIVGYHTADSMCTVTIENCSVTDSYIEVQGTGYGQGVGAILGYGKSAPSYKETEETGDVNGNGSIGDTIYVNVPYNIKNCYVNLDEDNFVSKAEDGVEDSGERVCHGGVMGVLGSNTSTVSDCVVIGIKPYATMEGTSANDAQHSGLESHFANVYTTSDVAITEVNLGGSGALANRNFTGKVFPLSDAQLKGAAAVENMDLDWSVWMADDEGYPELANAHKNVTLVDKEDGTHAVTCACGFGGIAVDHNFVNGECACGAELNCATRKTITWDGSVATGIATGSGTKDDPYVIKTAAELAWLVQQKADVTTDKYYKIDDSIGAIVLQSAGKAEAIMALDSAAATKAYFEAGSFTPWKTMGWEASCFAGYFDGNGATIYGMYAISANNAALFSTVDGGSAIRNIAIKNSYLVSEGKNYQVGALIGTSSNAGYGAKRQGIVWVSDVVIANNYMYNNAYNPNNNNVEHLRSGIIGGVGEAMHVENCLAYGNDATYNDGYKMPLIANVANAIVPAATHYDGFEPKISVNEETGEILYYNAVRNTVVLGADIMNTKDGRGWRKNDPACFDNCYTDGASGTVTFSNGEWTYTDEQIKAITEEDLPTLELGDAFINTDSYPELKAFHDAVFAGDPTANGAAGHAASCSCGLADSNLQPHAFVSDVEPAEWDSTYCSVCGYVCEHENVDEDLVEYEGDCLTGAGYEFTCSICGYYEGEIADPAGHNFVDREAQAGADCQTTGTIAHKYCLVCEKNYAADADDLEPFENALTDLTGELGDCVADTDEETGEIVYGADENEHWTTCGTCGEEITRETHTGEATPNGAEGHSLVCVVCGHASENAAHNFGDDNVCDDCEYECTEHSWVDDGEPVDLGWEATETACKTVAQKCEICGIAGEDREIGHTAGEWEAMMPYIDRNFVSTCVSDGQHTEILACTECFFQIDTKIVTDAKTGHDFDFNEATESTCTTEGNLAYNYCAACNYMFAEDAAYDEAYENAITSEDITLELNPENHCWEEYACTATCEEAGIKAHKFCSECYLLVVDGEETEIAIDWDAFYAYDEETYEPIGIGAKLDVALGKYESEALADFIAEFYPDLDVEAPVYPEDSNDWEVMDAYYAAYYAVMDALAEVGGQEAWYAYWEAIIADLQVDAYHEALLLAAAEAEYDMTAEAIGHAYDNDCDAECNNGCGTVREVPDHVYDNAQDTDCNVCGEVRTLAWTITVDTTGVYDIVPNDAYTADLDADDIIVTVKGEEVKYNEAKGGYPLVAGLEYTVEFADSALLENVDGDLAWNAEKTAEVIFPDTNAGDWYNDSVNYVVGAGIMGGYSTGKFGTSDSIQRQDFIVMLARYAGADLTAYENVVCTLTDVRDGEYYEAAVNWALAEGITTGYDNGKFGVGDKMTREQIVTFLYRYADKIGVDVTVDEGSADAFAAQYTDFGKVSTFSKEAIVWALENGVITGKNATTIAPQGNAQRCEVAKIMYNIFLNDIFA